MVPLRGRPGRGIPYSQRRKFQSDYSIRVLFKPKRRAGGILDEARNGEEQQRLPIFTRRTISSLSRIV
jgi:hypothetical protein